MIEWIPDFSYFAYKVKNPINLAKTLGYIEEKINNDDIFQSLDTLFWTITLIHRLDKQELLNLDKIREYIITLKHDNGGYKFSTNNEDPDIQSTFFCLAILKMLGMNELIEDKDVNFIINAQNSGGFIHCTSKNCLINCKGRPSIEFSLYAISALLFLDKIEEVDKKKLTDYLKKETKDDIDLIYQILCLKLLNTFEITDFEKKIPILTSWQLPQSGFGINTKFPSAEHTFWTGICLGLINRLDLANLEGIIDFLKGMQQDNGGFTGQYTSISSQKPTLINTAYCIMGLFYVWNFLIEEIENEILLRARDFSDIFLIPISEKLSISLNLIKEVTKWLISNDWVEGKILDRESMFESYFKRQNQISQEIIDKIMKNVKSFQKQKELDLNELSKSFDFSNPLERVKLVVNDLLINKFLTGNLKAYKKKYVLEDFALPGKYIHLTKPLPYTEIMAEKKRMKIDKQKLMDIRSELVNTPRIILENIQKIVEQEKIPEAKKKLEEDIKSTKERISKLVDLIEKINSEYKFIDFKFSNFKFQKNWPSIKEIIEKDLSITELKINEIIKKKEEDIARRSVEKIEQEAINNLRSKLRDIKKKLNLYQVEIKNFFPKKFTDHEKTLALIKSIFDYITNTDSDLNSEFSKFFDIFKLEQFKKELEQIKSSWEKEKIDKENIIKSYQVKIEKRSELNKLIEKITSELEEFSNDKNEQIIKLRNDGNLDEGFKLIDLSINNFKELHLKQIEAFNDFIKKTNEEISDFSKYSGDLVSDWERKLKIEEERWDNFVSDLKEKLHSSFEIEKKDELDKKLKNNVEDIQSSLENMKKTVLELVDANKIIEAGNSTKELNVNIDEKIKTYNQECKDFIKDSSREFKNFRETANKLIEYWESECGKLTQSLEETKNELKKKVNKKGILLRKNKLDELIKTENSNIEDKIENFKLNFNQIIDQGKKLDDFEEKFTMDLSQITNTLKESDDKIKELIKTASKIYDTFEETVSNEIKYWNEIKNTIENQLVTLSEKVNDEILIVKMQIIVNAFKDNKVDLNYLAKELKTKLEPFKSKIIKLISEKRLIAELEPTSDMFILKEE
ncbi:MAG: prenyltransferase/squalene oxidase repeat-containing protein, partial [Promethearchaeota archaeon]